jgi:hypothetical protein
MTSNALPVTEVVWVSPRIVPSPARKKCPPPNPCSTLRKNLKALVGRTGTVLFPWMTDVHGMILVVPSFGLAILKEVLVMRQVAFLALETRGTTLMRGIDREKGIVNVKGMETGTRVEEIVTDVLISVFMMTAPG